MYGIIGIKKQTPLHSFEGDALDGRNNKKMIDSGVKKSATMIARSVQR